MVMEVTPSPQCVGREFVRQYYTLLNQAPAHLHRFYSDNSMFIHGGPNRETKEVIGQEQIHEHIQQLNFRDCHAKISQVDSQATLGNGVVVQVSGELSNGGQPMRRFTQTFVLAAESPKKYYVHNDIFRYQDLLVDEDGDISHSEDEGDCESSTEIQNGQGGDYYPNSGDGSQLIENSSPTFPPPPTVTQPVAEPALPPAPVPEQFTTVKQVEDQVLPPASPSPPAHEEEPEPEPQVSTPSPPPPSNEPKTYANLLKGHASSQYAAPSYQRPASPPPVLSSKPQEPLPQFNPANRDAGLPRGPRPSGGPRGSNMRDNRPPPQTRASFSEDNDSEKSMGYRSGPPRHSGNFMPPSNGILHDDNKQLFLGNIPLCATDEELRALFGQFGTIVELKILSKGPKGQNNRVPNYGFLIYEDPSTVQTVLQNRPIYFPHAKDAQGIKLNVEEKKRRIPGPPDSRPPLDNRPRGPQGPMRGGRGGPRGPGMYRADARPNGPPSNSMRNSSGYKPR